MSGGVMPGGMTRRQDRLRNRGQLGHRRLDLGTRLKKHLDDRDTLHGLRLDVLDIIDRCGKGPFLTVTMRFSISSGDTPVNDQITLTTGMSMTGKISVGMRLMVTTPSSNRARAATTNV